MLQSSRNVNYSAYMNTHGLLSEEGLLCCFLYQAAKMVISEIHQKLIVLYSFYWLYIIPTLSSQVLVPQNRCFGNTITLPFDFCTEQLG